MEPAHLTNALVVWRKCRQHQPVSVHREPCPVFPGWCESLKTRIKLVR